MFKTAGWKVALSFGIFGALLAASAAVPVRAQAPLIAGPGLTLRYSDAQGAGCLSLQSIGPAADGGTSLSVTLTQNGLTFSGQGEEWSLAQTTFPPGPLPAVPTNPTSPANPALPVAPLPNGTALAFWLADGYGDMYFFDGSLHFGVDTLNAQGGWTSMQNPAVTGQWQGFAMFPSRTCL
jgi:hypothetical protein